MSSQRHRRHCGRKSNRNYMFLLQKNVPTMRRPSSPQPLSMIPSSAPNHAPFPSPSWRPDRGLVAVDPKWLLFTALLILSSVLPQSTRSCPPSVADSHDIRIHIFSFLGTVFFFFSSMGREAKEKGYIMGFDALTHTGHGARIMVVRMEHIFPHGLV